MKEVKIHIWKYGFGIDSCVYVCIYLANDFSRINR